jgi:hypothetical protein
VENDWLDADTKIIPNIGVEPLLSETVAQLSFDQPLSEAINGNKASFVALLTERTEKRPAKFDEVKDKVVADFKKAESAKIASQKISETALLIVENLSKNLKVDDISELKNAEKIPPFSLVEPPVSPFAYALMDLTLKTLPGTLSEKKELPDGEFILVFVDEKLPPEKKSPEDLQKFKTEYLDMKSKFAWFNFITSSMNKDINKKEMKK